MEVWLRGPRSKRRLQLRVEWGPGPPALSQERCWGTAGAGWSVNGRGDSRVSPSPRLWGGYAAVDEEAGL